MRKDGDLLFRCPRQCPTNQVSDYPIAFLVLAMPNLAYCRQRLRFDISRDGQTVITGSADGRLLAYDLTSGDLAWDVDCGGMLVCGFS